MSVKTQFSIKDLENLSGVKAHTIRIWEKRYNLLEPERTDTNIRQYDLLNLKKLLNVTLLYNEGYKISKIASFKEPEIVHIIESLKEVQKESYALQAFKSAMFDFDHKLFIDTLKEVKKEKNFREIFYDIFIPLLSEIGTLWQTSTIDPAHERFISELIKQEIIIHIYDLQKQQNTASSPKFALYLPHEEIHEIGLLYANYEILFQGYNTVYLGSNIPLNNLKHLLKHYDNLTFLSYFTVKPDQETPEQYVERFYDTVGDLKTPLWLMGAKTQNLDPQKLPKTVTLLANHQELKNAVSSLK